MADSQAILAYIAAKYRPGEWDGRDAAERGRIARWLSVAANEIANGPAALRLAALFGAAIDRTAAEALTGRVLAFLDAHLAERTWLEGERRTIADFACAPYLALAHQGGVELDAHTNIRTWLRALEGAPGFVAMTGWER
jgi:glutathione S-transferase